MFPFLNVTRRALFGSAAGLAALAALPALGQQIAPAGEADPAPPSDDWKSGTKLVLLGTQGGPLMNLNRAMTSQAVVVNGRIYLVDLGYGAVRRILEMGMRLGDVSQVLITHHHSDHLIDLPALMNIAWAGGVKGPVTIHGPAPIADAVKGAIAAFSEDYRTRGTGGRFPPVQEVFPVSELTAGGPVFEDDRVRVTAIKVPHSELPLSLAFRFDSAERSIVLSGDTAFTKDLAAFAKDADVLVHEAMYWPGIEGMLREQGGGTIKPGRMEYFKNEHTTSEDAARIAAEAGVGTLVLSHLISGPAGASDQAWIRATGDIFKGKIIVARDRMVI